MRSLVFAYACEPNRGSEPGAGWAWTRLLAAFGDVCVVTRANNEPAIRDGMAQIPEAGRIRFLFVDPPAAITRWKKGQRGIRLFYLLWQISAVRAARRIARREGFDVVWHLTIANVWMGSLAPLVRGRFVYGPVGGGVTPPIRLLPVAGVRGALYELLRLAARGFARYANPMARLAWARADLILTQNQETVEWLPRRVRHKARVLPNVVFEEQLPAGDARATTKTAVYAGNLLPLKGLPLAIEALRWMPGWRLRLFGRGPDEERLRAYARRVGLSDRVHFEGWIERRELLKIIGREADVMMFPSLHEEAGWSIGEALALGVPAVALDLGGPPALGAHAVTPASPAPTARALADAAIEVAGSVAPQRAFDLDVKRDAIRDVLAEFGLIPPG